MKNIYNKLRIVGCSLIVVALSSCSSDFLNVAPTSTLTTGNAYNSAQDLSNALNGAYRTFYEEYYQWDNVLLGDVRSDNSYNANGDSPIDAYDQLNITTSNNRMMANWSQLYTGIARANIILEKIKSVNDPELDKNNLRENIIGQASFLRAFHYFQLVRNYGGVPIELHSNSTDPATINLARSTEKEVYDQIDADLQIALANLPDSYAGGASENKVRATKGAANALLAKIWAQRSDRDYTKVLKYCNDVINSPAGYGLVTNYADLFDGDHYFNKESILEVSFQGGNWDVSNWGVQLFLAPEDGWQKYATPSKNLIAAYDAQGDVIRKDASVVFWDNLDWADENWNPCGDKTIAVPFPYKEKHADGWNSGDHPYLLRLDDIILLKAEAQNELNDLPGALLTIKQIRDRVSLPILTASSKADMKTKILNERRLELAFEGERWYDLVRAGVCTTVMNSLNEVKYTCGGGTASAPISISYNCTDAKWLCPIPQLERDTNPNLTQNPGY
ncbi:MAG: RagB/SusD family nutrient uptake outer membrane protein [Flavobacterium sp.]|uniref:RagB/SusD family nutrient uptake outer membrane protein n=1 Tax=Flavobacterium sp. TaxID=239 RepID=UPI002605823C|nr:RagB/SusD family nutrient uptake outer membrane protein [Flavobacterium sp.]MDD5150578.1 RagB/SusD family nutrient uptake outer membrane protein [Flavobacterium sp.]